MKILCVCLGNICRSPMAEGVIRAKALTAGLEIRVDSAGTGDYHLGEPPDSRGLTTAAARGYDNSDQRARQVRVSDFRTFDLIVAMDRSNLDDLLAIQPRDGKAKVRLFHPDGIDIPDPFYGGLADYEKALDMIETSAEALIRDLARPMV